MLRIRSDVPLRGDGASRFVFCLVTVLVFMAALAITANSYVGALLQDWNTSVTGTLTVQIPRSENAEQDIAMADNLARALQDDEQVAMALVVPPDQISTLLEPWLGNSEIVADLPLPILIDVQLNTGTQSESQNVVLLIGDLAPNAIVEDHRVWLNRISELAEGLGFIALAVMALVTGALGLIVIFATRASLTEYAQAIDVLHIVGARDGYIARQFARRALVPGVFGGFVGLLVYIPVLAAIIWLGTQVQDELLPDISLPLYHWLIILALPFIAGGLAMITADLTVRRYLASKA